MRVQPASQWRSWAARLLSAGLLVGVPLLGHYAVVDGRGDLGALFLIGIAVALIVRHAGGATPWFALAALAAFLLVPALETEWLFIALPEALYLAAASMFGRTLLPGREPLITRFARLEHRPFPDELVPYTRRLTWIWALFLVALAAIEAALWLTASKAVWSLFANLLSYLLVAALFAGEYAYRRVRFPHLRHLPFTQMAQLVRDAYRRR